jgi:large subunit ribosomal protein L15
MKLHDLRPAPGSHKKKTRVGRGIAAGKGKTAGRGTKGQKARAGGKIPAWFEGGQTPLHQRIPKLRGFKNLFKIEYEVVNVGAIANLVELGVLESGEMPGSKKAKDAAAAPITVNQEILRAAGLVRSLDKPMKILGNGELSTALFVVADAVSGPARGKIEAAGGTVSLLEVPTKRRPAMGLESDETAVAPIAGEAAETPAAVAASDEEVAPARPKGKATAAPADDAPAPAPARAKAKPAARKPKADATAPAADETGSAETAEAEGPDAGSGADAAAATGNVSEAEAPADEDATDDTAGA